METRPKINLKHSRLDNLLERASKMFLFVIWVLTFYIFLKLPTTIPIHFNAAGQADGYGSKLTLFIIPIVATVIYFGLTALNKHPQIFNYMTTITESNALRQYTLATRMLRCIKLAILIVSLLIILFTYLTVIGVTNGLGLWFLPVALGLLLTPALVFISQSLKKKNAS